MNPTFVNAVPITVSYRSGPKKGLSEQIHYRELDLIEIYTWAELTRDKRTPQLLAFVTGLPLDEVRHLSFASAGELADKIFELNFPNALTLLRDPVMGAMLRPLLQETAEALTKLTPEQLAALEAAGKSGSGSLSAQSSSASEVATGSASSASLPPGSPPSSPPKSESSPVSA